MTAGKTHLLEHGARAFYAQFNTVQRVRDSQIFNGAELVLNAMTMPEVGD